MLYILPNPGGMGGRGGKYPRRKYKPGKIATHGPGLPKSAKPTVWRPSARRAHPPSKTVGGRKIRKALGPGKHYRHRIVYWSKSPKGGDEGVRSPYYVKGNAMARRRKHSRKYRRRNASGLLLRVNKRRRHGKRRRSNRRNPFVLGNRRRRRSRRNTFFTNRRRRGGRRRSRRNPFFYNRKRRRSGRRSRRNATSTLQLFNRGRRRSRRYSRRNPAVLGIIPSNLTSVGGIGRTVTGFVNTAIPVGLGYVGVRLVDQYVWAPLWVKTVNKWTEKSTDTTKQIANTVWDTLTHVVTASVGAGIAIRFVKRHDAAALFAAGVAINWIRKVANIWVTDPKMKSLLAGSEDDLSDYVQYDVPGAMSDYVETNEGRGVGDYVETY